jgi:hypothetical protein
LPPAAGQSGGGVPWGWIIGGGAAVLVLVGVIGLVVIVSSLFSRPQPGPVVANVPNNAANNAPAEQPAAPVPFRPQPNPFEAASSPPTPAATPASSNSNENPASSSGENPFETAEAVALPNRPTGLPGAGADELENPFESEPIGNEPATPATTSADVTAAAGWAVRPDPPAIPVEYKKGKISIPFPNNAQLRLPHGPSHFVLGTVSQNRMAGFQVFDRASRSGGP